MSMVMEDEYRRLLGEIRDAYCLLQDGRLVFVSSELFRRFGYHPEDLIGKPFIELIAPEAREDLLEVHRSKLRKYRTAERYESLAITADGKRVPVEILGWMTHFRGRAAIAGIVTDISDRKRTENALRESEEKFRVMFESMPVGITVIDSNFIIVDLNATALRLYGATSKGEVIGREIFRYFSDEYHSQVRTILHDAAERGRIIETECKGRTQEGREYDAELSVVVMPEKHGRKAQFIVATTDTTWHKQAERELMEAEELNQALVETASRAGEGIALIQDTSEMKATYVFVNAEFARMLGYQREELLGMPALMTVAPSRREDQIEGYTRRQRGEEMPPRYELEMLKKDGQPITVDVGAGITTYRGKVATVAYVKDITERKQQEVERFQLQEALRSYASQVVRAQEEERRRLARDLHDDTIQELLFALHRLADITGGTCGELPEAARQLLEQIRSHIERTMTEVRSITQDLRPFMLDDMGLVPTLRWLAERLSTGLGGPHVSVHVTGKQRRLGSEIELALFRVAQEALSNARKHAGASSIRVSLEFGTDEVELIVSDNGRGLDRPILPNELAKQGKSGLLGMSERILLLDGKFHIDSQNSRGTTISAKVPSRNSVPLPKEPRMNPVC